MRTATATVLVALATSLFASTAAFAQESPVCVGKTITTGRSYVDPASNEECLASVNRLTRYTANPDTDASVQGGYFAGFDYTTFQSGSTSSYFIGRLRRHLETSILEPVEMECEDDNNYVGPREVVVETYFFFDDSRMVQRDCATGTTTTNALPMLELPYMESVIHWDAPCGERPLTEVIEARTFESIEDIRDSLDLYVQGECSF